MSRSHLVLCTYINLYLLNTVFSFLCVTGRQEERGWRAERDCDLRKLRSQPLHPHNQQRLRY